MLNGAEYPFKLKVMSYLSSRSIWWPEYAIIVTDESDNNKVFENYEESIREAEVCQEGIIIEIG